MANRKSTKNADNLNRADQDIILMIDALMNRMPCVAESGFLCSAQREMTQ